jgi:hypothetical protein
VCRAEELIACPGGVTALKHQKRWRKSRRQKPKKNRMMHLQYCRSEGRSACQMCQQQRPRRFQRGAQTFWTRKNSSRSDVICALPFSASWNAVDRLVPLQREGGVDWVLLRPAHDPCAWRKDLDGTPSPYSGGRMSPKINP